MKRTWRETNIYLRVMNLARVLNVAKLVLAHYLSRVLKRPIVWGVPFAISIEPTTVCNLHCPECPTGNGTLGRSKGTMPLKQFRKYIEMLPKETFHLNLFLQGEPLLNTHLAEFVLLASARKMVTVISTNAQIMNAAMALQLVDAGLSKLIVSIDGTTQDTYERYRMGGHLHKVESTLGFINHAKQLRQSKTPLIEMQFIAFAHNEHQVSDFKRLAKKNKADIATIKKAQLYQTNSSLVQQPLDKKLSRYDKNNGKIFHKGNPYRHCFKISTSIVSTWNGQLAPCCMDKDMEHPLGNLNNTTWADAWNNQTIRQFRTTILHAREQVAICKNCSEGRSFWI
jgi:radical SAM protein with 4Fe4S-binding SPASM domain